MEFRKIVTITLYARQQKRHRCIEQSFGLCGRGQGWDDLGEGIGTCILSYVKWIASPGSMHDTGWVWCTGMVRGGRRKGGSEWGTRVHPWRIHVDVWQNQYNIVKQKKKKIVT